MSSFIIKFIQCWREHRGWTPKDASQTEGCDEPVDEIEDVAEPLDESVDEEAKELLCHLRDLKWHLAQLWSLLSMQGGLYLL